MAALCFSLALGIVAVAALVVAGSGRLVRAVAVRRIVR